MKLVTLTSNYAATHGGQLLLRLSHLYQAGEHPTLATPVTVNLEEVFGEAGLKTHAATETTLTANRPAAAADAAKHAWTTHAPNAAVAAQLAEMKREGVLEKCRSRINTSISAQWRCAPYSRASRCHGGRANAEACEVCAF